MSAQTLTTALTTGVMKPIGDQLTREQMRAVASYLAPAEAPVGTAWIDQNMCAPERRTVDLSAKPAQIGFGVDLDNTRRMSAAQAGLTTKDLGNLEVAWALALPRTSGLRGQGVVVGETLFYPAGQANHVLALDTKSGCVKWATATPSQVRTSLTFGRLGKDGPLGLVGGDSAGNLIAFDAQSGKILWRADPRHDKTTQLTGTPLIHEGRIVTPISGTDVAAAMRGAYECCKGHGAVVAVDGKDGKVLWTWHTMEDAKPLGRQNSQGAAAYGPSGAPIWSSPAIDVKRGVVFASTGENTSPPATVTSDAIASIDLATGRQNWVFQALENDVWNMSCPVGIDAARPPGPNCYFFKEGSVLLDHDFGAGPVVFRGKGGKDVVLGGQKSGDVWALDPANGKVLWRQQFGKGSALGGVHWGIATDGTRVFAPISDPNVPKDQSAAGMHAVDVRTGKVAWQWRAEPDCTGERAKIGICGNRYGLSAAPLVIDGAVVAGSLDGRVWVFDARSGKVLAMHDTITTAYKPVNGIPGAGGSIDAAGVFAGDGMLFVNSGYGSFGQAAGNVLVAYRPKK
ncbi:PQQ-binding-like beta-propeller repeat protein [Phenylobacterium sp. J367]|uniref:outer membrane protein assembly factor BamB family protein n=1 Tax=Phenylobacterium sp. J367 TaxID=2898435 RepID=UPI00215085B9|nr:PQQ-binding-like beta-propeller repeat protein [Phenylobacterium sp. J367]MCR5878147.1 PQQ-binding-like beta-propeller repeat protein [Phenylobacterium sp. J367]